MEYIIKNGKLEYVNFEYKMNYSQIDHIYNFVFILNYIYNSLNKYIKSNQR